MTVVWTTAFLDAPTPTHTADVAFWAAATNATVSARRGDVAQFATLVPADGDAFLRVQRLGDQPRIHVDLHVDDLDAQVGLALRLGAAVLAREDHVVLASPGGFVFCLVRDAGERVRPAAVTGPLGGASLVDQVCLDVPAASIDVERAFWPALTGWAAHRGSRREFTVLDRPAGMPLRIMLQELGDDDPRRDVTAHLDVACGRSLDAVRDDHLALGAQVVGPGHGWAVMRDTVGRVYCLTPRDPLTGLMG
jgi:hypothetical protein